MARSANYGIEKRQRELKKQKKNQQKAERKLEKATDSEEGKDAPDGDRTDGTGRRSARPTETAPTSGVPSR